LDVVKNLGRYLSCADRTVQRLLMVKFSKLCSESFHRLTD